MKDKPYYIGSYNIFFAIEINNLTRCKTYNRTLLIVVGFTSITERSLSTLFQEQGIDAIVEGYVIHKLC